MSSRFAALGAVVLAAVMLVGPAHAHDGHDHGAAPPPVSKSIAPRGEAASDALELTAIPQDGTVAFYLDRFRTNEPIKGAVVEVETPEGPRNAKETDEAAYVLPAPWMTKPGSHDLLVTVTAGDIVDVLTVSVTVPDAKPSTPVTSSASPSAMARATDAVIDLKGRLSTKDPILMLVAGGAFLLGMLITVTMRGRRSLPAVAVVAVVVTLVLGGAAFAHGDEDHGAPVQGSALIDPAQPSSDLAQRLPDGSVFVPKPTQRLLVLRTTMTEKGTFHRTVELPGGSWPGPCRE
jgi:cobalt-zinc-cadmium efflux system membrane fusion protein